MVRRDFHPLAFGLRSGAVNGTRRSAKKMVDRSLRAKAICCLGLVCGVLGLGFASVLQNQAPIVSGPEWIDAAHKLPGAAVQIPQVAAATEPVGPTLSIFMRAAPNCPAPAQAAAEAKRLSKAGVKRIMLQFKQDESDEHEGGTLFFPTTLGPVARGFEDGRLLKFAQALDAEGIEVCAWVPLFNDAASARTHPDWRALVYSEEHGITPREHWLCPRHPDALAYEASIVRAAVQAGGPHLRGVFLDFIRFDDDFSCTCEPLSGRDRQTPRPIVDPGARTAPRAEKSQQTLGSLDRDARQRHHRRGRCDAVRHHRRGAQHVDGSVCAAV